MDMVKQVFIAVTQSCCRITDHGVDILYAKVLLLPGAWCQWQFLAELAVRVIIGSSIMCGPQ